MFLEPYPYVLPSWIYLFILKKSITGTDPMGIERAKLYSFLVYVYTLENNVFLMRQKNRMAL